MKNEKWMDSLVLPGSVPHIRKKTDKKEPEKKKLEGTILYGSEPDRVLGPKEQKIYDDYVRYCDRLGCPHDTEEGWRMSSQRIPNQ